MLGAATPPTQLKLTIEQCLTKVHAISPEPTFPSADGLGARVSFPAVGLPIITIYLTSGVQYSCFSLLLMNSRTHKSSLNSSHHKTFPKLFRLIPIKCPLTLQRTY